MKTTALGLLLASLAAAPTLAAGLGFAVKGGSHTSWARVEGPLSFDTDAETRFAIGIGVPMRLSERFWLEPELLYAETAFSSSDFGPTARITARTVLLPLPLKLGWSATAAVSPHVATGPAVAFIGRTRQEFAAESADVSDDVRDLDFAWLFGAGVGVRAGRGRVTLDLRSTIGLRHLDETENDIKIRGFQALLGYAF